MFLPAVFLYLYFMPDVRHRHSRVEPVGLLKAACVPVRLARVPQTRGMRASCWDAAGTTRGQKPEQPGKRMPWRS